MKKDRHEIMRLLSLPVTFDVKVEFFRFVTFWSTLRSNLRSKEQLDLAELFDMFSGHQRAYIRFKENRTGEHFFL